MLLATVHQDIGMNDAQPLAQLNGPIVLAGAGKMGGAMLAGWLGRGLDARQVAVLEPKPSGEISALAAKGIRLNPSPKDIGAVATLVGALQPQRFREASGALENVAGSGELLHRLDAPSATLRQNVTSPGGTTAAALEVLMGPDGMQSLLIRAVAAATRRSRELAK